MQYVNIYYMSVLVCFFANTCVNLVLCNIDTVAFAAVITVLNATPQCTCLTAAVTVPHYDPKTPIPTVHCARYRVLLCGAGGQTLAGNCSPLSPLSPSSLRCREICVCGLACGNDMYQANRTALI